MMILCCRNRILLSILNICRDSGDLPKVVGIDIVEMALWAKVHLSYALFISAPSLSIGVSKRVFFIQE